MLLTMCGGIPVNALNAIAGEGFITHIHRNDNFLL